MAGGFDGRRQTCGGSTGRFGGQGMPCPYLPTVTTVLMGAPGVLGGSSGSSGEFWGVLGTEEFWGQYTKLSCRHALHGLLRIVAGGGAPVQGEGAMSCEP